MFKEILISTHARPGMLAASQGSDPVIPRPEHKEKQPACRHRTYNNREKVHRTQKKND